MKNNFETRKAHSFEVRAAETGKKADGYAIVYNSPSEDLGFEEYIAPGAFDKSLAAMANGQLNIFALWDHDSQYPLASTASGKLTLTSDARGLAFKMDTTRMTPLMLSALEDGDMQMSFGFNVVSQKWEERDDGTYVRTILEGDLGEISFVIWPAYSATEAALRSLGTVCDVRQTNLRGAKEAAAWLKKAIALHEKHMNGSAPTTGKEGEKSQMLMMEQMKNALAELGEDDGSAPTTGKEGEKSQMPKMEQMKNALAKLEVAERNRVFARLVRARLPDAK